jgi:hypothetical protein
MAHLNNYDDRNDPHLKVEAAAYNAAKISHALNSSGKFKTELTSDIADKVDLFYRASIELAQVVFGDPRK